MTPQKILARGMLAEVSARFTDHVIEAVLDLASLREAYVEPGDPHGLSPRGHLLARALYDVTGMFTAAFVTQYALAVTHIEDDTFTSDKSAEDILAAAKTALLLSIDDWFSGPHARTLVDAVLAKSARRS